jgi:hypothetical protein
MVFVDEVAPYSGSQIRYRHAASGNLQSSPPLVVSLSSGKDSARNRVGRPTLALARPTIPLNPLSNAYCTVNGPLFKALLFPGAINPKDLLMAADVGRQLPLTVMCNHSRT